jgi:peptidoglycan/xylan/chitin deacetylase (PgdA/CDA1 family)
VNGAGVREAAERILDRAGWLDRLLWLRARVGRRDLAVLTYHRVGNDDGTLDPEIFDVTPAELGAQLEVLRAQATAVSLADVRRFLRGRRLPPNPVLVTFDDGYADAEVALPLLRRAGVPATFFIPTAYPEGGRLFWWDRIWLLLRRCSKSRVELAYPARLTLAPVRSLPTAARAVIAAVKRTERPDLPRLWEALEKAAGVTLDPAEERLLASRTLLCWNGVRRLRDAGMDVQSHAHEHLVLNALPPEGALRDLHSSARVLREVLGEAPYAVAYPVGYDLGDAHRGVPRAAGFELGFTNGTGLCLDSHADPFNVPRVSMDMGIGVAGYKVRLLLGEGGRPRAPWKAAYAADSLPDPLGPASAEAHSA